MKATFTPGNYTPHDITIQLRGSILEYPSVGVCRAKQRERCAFIWDPDHKTECHFGGWGVEEPSALVVMRKPKYDAVEWSPGAPGEGADVIVSVVAAPVVTIERSDLRVFVPDTGTMSAVRDNRGRIKAIRRLILWHDPYAATHLLWVISLVNPVNEGDGSYVHSRHLPTREGIAEAIDENHAGGILELVNRSGQSRLSAHQFFDVQSDQDELWNWLKGQVLQEAGV